MKRMCLSLAGDAEVIREVTRYRDEPNAYLRNCRIRAAMKLLEAGQSITSTALRLKFCSAQYFATVFKSEIGVSPRTWQRR